MGCCSMLLNSFPSLCVLLLIIANRDTSLWFNIWQLNFQFSYCFSLHELKAIGSTYHLVHYNCYPLIDYPIFYQVKIVIIDSVAFHFRQGFEDLALRTRILGEMALKLVKLAKMCNLAVTNICSLYCRFLSVPSSPFRISDMICKQQLTELRKVLGTVLISVYFEHAYHLSHQYDVACFL